MSEPRRLPILGQKPAPPLGAPSLPLPDQDDDRPPWHWSAIGTVLVFVLWLPLSMVTAWVGQGRTPVAQLVAAITGLALAAIAGGAIVARYGKTAGVREATVSGLAVGIVATLVAIVASGQPANVWVLVPVGAFSAGFCHLGGRLGMYFRQKRS